MIDPASLVEPLRAHVPQQRWYAGDATGLATLRIASADAVEDGLLHAVLDTAHVDAPAVATYSLLLGLRPADEAPPEALTGKPEAVVGEVDGVLVYDAMVDPVLALRLLAHVAPDQHAEHARPLLAESTNSSVVFDERLILKLFRRLPEGRNPDAEVTRALVAAGFPNVAAPVAEWSAGGRDLAVVNGYLAGGADGFSLALTSLRDLFDEGGPPEGAGGDFAPDARRLGIITAKLHLAMAEAFGTSAGDPAVWAAAMEAHLARLGPEELDPTAVAPVYDALRRVRDPGPALRVHGDYHLGQVLRTDAGWFVLDFEGEPVRPLAERRAPSSPLRDVAGMVRSFSYAAAVALREWRPDELPVVTPLAEAWERRNTFAYVEGYLAADGVDALLPRSEGERDAVLRAFQLDKAVYEVGYERAHRPDWADIPLGAVHRLVALT